MYMQHVQYMLLFLVLVVNPNMFLIPRSNMLLIQATIFYVLLIIKIWGTTTLQELYLQVKFSALSFTGF